MRDAADNELRLRVAEHREAWAYYNGQHKRWLKQTGLTDDNVVINLVRQAIDRTVSFLVPEFPRLEIDELQDTPAEQYLRKVWKAAGDTRLLAKLAKFGSLDGHCFAKVMPEGNGKIRVVALNPANVLVWWKADDMDQRLWYEVRWTVGSTDYRQDIVQGEGGWLIVDYERNAMTSRWREVGRMDWPYPMGPIVDWQHMVNPENYYGDSETGNLALNDRVNKTASDIAKILRTHAYPRVVGTGFQASEVTETAIDNFWTIPDPAAKVAILEMQSDLAASNAQMEHLMRAFMAERRVVVLRGDVSDFQRVTNLGIRALFIDQIAKNEELRRNYEVGIREISQRILMLGGLMEVADTADIEVHWPDPLPVDPKESIEVATMERELGIVSQETIARQRGYDWQMEQARLASESGNEIGGMIDQLMQDQPTEGAQQ